jgi:quercetin dioxygenase-like cupin family protein
MHETASDVRMATGLGPERRVSGPFVSFDLPFEIARVRAESAYEREGHCARTLAKYPDLRVVLVAMKAGAKMGLHETAERMTMQIAFGQCRLWFAHGENVDLAEGGFAAVDARLAHEIECLEECAFLLTIAWPPAAQ